MSINAVNPADSGSGFKKRLLTAAGVGFAAGAAGTAMKKNWLYNGMPSDVFVKSASKNLEETMSSDELKEAAKVNSFLKSVVDPEVDLETLKPQIKESKELSDAIKLTPDETVEGAIKRVFSNPDKDQVKQDLLDLQFKTKSDKKSDRNTALRLIYDNFDAKNKKFVKSKTTSDTMFGIVKKTADTIQKKAVTAGGAVAGLAAAALCLVAYEVPGENDV